MKYFILGAYLLLTLDSFSQETKFITRTSSDIKKLKEKERNTLILGPTGDFIEEYYVLKNDENIRHGTYVKYRKTFEGDIQILESGGFQNGKQNGLWEFYYDIDMENASNSIKEKGVYVNGRKNGVWTSYYADTIPEIINQEKFGKKRKADSIDISINQQFAKIKIVGMYLNDKRVGEWTSFTYTGDVFQKFNFSKKLLLCDPSIEDTLEYNTNRKALFIGGLPCLLDFIGNEFDLTGYLRTKTEIDSTSVIVSFVIDKDGNAIERKIESSTGNKGLENEALRIVALTGDRWIPAITQAIITTSVYKIQFFIIKVNVSPTEIEFNLVFEPVF